MGGCCLCSQSGIIIATTGEDEREEMIVAGLEKCILPEQIPLFRGKLVVVL